MPISSIDDCGDAHWEEVYSILSDSITDAGFKPKMVSEADYSGLIHKRIIENLYENPIVVCDVSCKNPNVMFELGLRLAFDKPTIIVKDDKTAYSFDTSPIEHVGYPRDLRFNQIVNFKETLSERIKATHQKSNTDPNYTTFLKNFGEFKVAKLNKKEVTGQEYILDELKNLKNVVLRQEQKRRSWPVHSHEGQKEIDICLKKVPENELDKRFLRASDLPSIKDARLFNISEGHSHFVARVKDGYSPNKAKMLIRDIFEGDSLLGLPG